MARPIWPASATRPTRNSANSPKPDLIECQSTRLKSSSTNYETSTENVETTASACLVLYNTWQMSTWPTADSTNRMKCCNKCLPSAMNATIICHKSLWRDTKCTRKQGWKKRQLLCRERGALSWAHQGPGLGQLGRADPKASGRSLSLSKTDSNQGLTMERSTKLP